MSKYKVGDRVKVRNDIKRLESYRGVSVTGGMAKMAGETFTVASAHYEEGWYYRLAETGCIWTDEMFESQDLNEKPTAEETIEKIRGKMLDYSHAQGAIGEIELLKYINEKLSEYYNGRGVDPPQLNYWTDDLLATKKGGLTISRAVKVFRDQTDIKPKPKGDGFGPFIEALSGKMWQTGNSVDYPEHYNHGHIETIDVIKMALTPEEFKGFLKGNVLKYEIRAPYKNETPDEDYQKARDYYDMVQELEEIE